MYYTYGSREDDKKHLLVTVQINGEQLAQQVSCSEYLVTYNQNGWSGDLDIRGSWVPADDNPMFINADITLTNEQVEDLSEGKDVRLTIKLMLDEVNELNITLTGEPEDFILNS